MNYRKANTADCFRRNLKCVISGGTSWSGVGFHTRLRLQRVFMFTGGGAGRRGAAPNTDPAGDSRFRLMVPPGGFRRSWWKEDVRDDHQRSPSDAGKISHTGPLSENTLTCEVRSLRETEASAKRAGGVCDSRVADARDRRISGKIALEIDKKSKN